MFFQFRFEAFNALNIAHYNQPDSTFGTGNFGRITGGNTPRILQFAGKFNF